METPFEVLRGASNSQKYVGQDRKCDEVQMIQLTFTHSVGKTERFICMGRMHGPGVA